MFGRNREKKKKVYADDDGRTIVDMNIDGFSWYNPALSKKKLPKEERPTRKETLALIRGVFLAYLPRVLSVVIGFGLALGIIVCWLHGWSFN